MKRIFVLIVALAMVLGMAICGHATLIDKGGGLIYDDDLNITWLQDANYAATELNDTRVGQIIAAVGSVAGHTLATSDFPGYGTGSYPGKMTWWGAMAWADQLVYQGYDDWRLPTTPGTRFGYVNEGEMGHLYYTAHPDGLGNSAGGPLVNTGPFTDLQAFYYWSGTEYAANPYNAWYFYFNNGNQRNYNKYGSNYALAVRPGDVSAPIPEPATMLLLGSGERPTRPQSSW